MAQRHGHPDTDNHDRLRRSAKDLIDSGSTPPNRGGSLSVDALQLLYQRASTPETAADALRLLHELQTYQVELDLLYEQLQANEQEVAEELAHYKSLYEQAPAGYLVLGKGGEILKSNRAADEIFGQPALPLAGKHLRSLLGAYGNPNALPTEALVTLPDNRQLTLHTRPATNGNSVLMILTEAAAQPKTF